MCVGQETAQELDLGIEIVHGFFCSFAEKKNSLTRVKI